MLHETPAAPSFYSCLGDDPDLGELVTMFVDEIPDRIQKLLDCLNEGNRDELARVAHQIKGAAGSYGFGQITPYAAELEQAVRAGEEESCIRRSLGTLIMMCQRMRAGAGPIESAD